MRKATMTFTISNALDLVFFVTGVLLVFRKVEHMERHHTLRVFLLTAVLSIAVIFVFNYVFTLVSPTSTLDSCEPQQFCLTE